MLLSTNVPPQIRAVDSLLLGIAIAAPSCVDTESRAPVLPDTAFGEDVGYSALRQSSKGLRDRTKCWYRTLD